LPTAPPPYLPTLSLHDALPICTLTLDDLEIGHAYRVTASKDGFTTADRVVQPGASGGAVMMQLEPHAATLVFDSDPQGAQVLIRSEEHTSELQSLAYLVCRLLL